MPDHPESSITGSDVTPITFNCIFEPISEKIAWKAEKDDSNN
jgi:hypothetical protein